MKDTGNFQSYQSIRKHRKRKILNSFVICFCVLLLFVGVIMMLCGALLTNKEQQKDGEISSTYSVPDVMLSDEGNNDTVDGSGADDTDNDDVTVLSDDEMLSYIEENSELYPERMVEFAETYPEAIAYVYHYPERGFSSGEIDLTAEATSDTVPLLIQWDERWGYESYGDGLIGYNGCGPTCLSMITLYLTGNADYTPLYIAQFADERGYYVDGSGTAWDLFNEGCEEFGITSNTIGISELTMIAELEMNHPLVCSVKEGDFTEGGHFIVIAGYQNGAFIVNDPNSYINSGCTWTFDELSPQIRSMWAFSLSDDAAA